jgi:hypothetical protein
MVNGAGKPPLDGTSLPGLFTKGPFRKESIYALLGETLIVGRNEVSKNLFKVGYEILMTSGCFLDWI